MGKKNSDVGGGVGERVLAIYKSSGGMPSDTLNFKLFGESATEIVKICGGFSLEFFSHNNFRANVCNSFVPGEMPRVDPEVVDGKLVFHAPILRNMNEEFDGHTDFRVLLSKNNLNSFNAILIDPPFTAMQQKTLYTKWEGCGSTKKRKRKEAADVLKNYMVNSQESIGHLYKNVIAWSQSRATKCIVVWGYKSGDIPDWKRLVVLIGGSGSGHPDVIGTVYVKRDGSPELNSKILESLTKVGKSLHALVCDDVPLHKNVDFLNNESLLDMGFGTCEPIFENMPLLFKLYPRQSEYTSALNEHSQQASPHPLPKSHPAYLSQTFVRMYELYQKGFEMYVISPQFRLFATATIENNKHTLFSENNHNKRFIIATTDWSEDNSVLFVIHISPK